MISYRKDIDGLRAISVLSVMLFHADLPFFSGGFIGVDIFFVISGFLISSIILEECVEERFSLLRFYERRIRRIFPALFFVLAFTTIISAFFLLPPDLKDYGQSLAAASVSLSNVMFWWDTGYFSTYAFQKPLLHTWSLGVEEQFYVFFPLFILFIYALKLKKQIPFLFTAIFLISLTASAWLVFKYPEFAFYMSFTRAWELLLGAIIALNIIPGISNKAINEILAVTGFLSIAAAVFLYSSNTPFPGLAALLPCLGGGLLIYTGEKQKTTVTRFLSAPPLVFIGLISYSLYLWHWPLFSFYRYYKYDHLTPVETVIILGLSFLMAVLSWKYVEQPFRGKTDLFSSRMIFLLAGVCVALAVGAGVFFHVTKGMPDRFSPSVNAAIDARSQNNPRHEFCLLEGNADALTPLSPCLFGKSKNDEYEMVVWGDSHADHFIPGIEKRALNEGFGGRQITKSGCPPLPGVTPERSTLEKQTDCKSFNDKVLQLILSDKNIRTVVLSAHWALYTENTVIGIGGQTNNYYLTNENLTTLDKKTSRQVFGQSFKKVIEKLLEAGKKVILIGPLPEPGYRVPDCLARAQSGYFAIKSCGNPERKDVDDRTAYVRTVLQEIKKEHPQVEVFSPLDIICTDEICAISHDNKPLYMDDNHLSSEGAKYLTDFIRLP